MNISHPLKLSLRAWPLAFALSGAALGVATTLPALAQSANAAKADAKAAVSVELQAFKVGRDANGKEQLQSAQSAKPGDVLEYRAVYANTSSEEVKNLQATLPIPAATQVLLSSALPKKVNASRDGRNFAPAPLMQVVTLPSGAKQTRPVPLSAYRALRWPVGTLAAGKNVVVRARVRLNPTLVAN